METEVTNYLEKQEESEQTSSDIDKSSVPLLEGVCVRCLDSGFVHTVKDGNLGIMSVMYGEDSSGRPKFKLVRCDHNVKVSY